jgi:hypothetical protein
MRRALLIQLVVALIAVPAGAQMVRSEAAGLRFSVPSVWPRVPAPSDMRAAQFKVPHADADSEDGELVLFYFGKGQGGSPEQNVERWTSQFTRSDGKPAKDGAVVTIRTVNGLKQTSVDVAGTYKPMAMGGSGGVDKPGWRLLAAVVEGPGGPWFWRLTGPENTVGAAKPQLDALLASLEAHQ